MLYKDKNIIFSLLYFIFWTAVFLKGHSKKFVAKLKKYLKQGHNFIIQLQMLTHSVILSETFVHDTKPKILQKYTINNQQDSVLIKSNTQFYLKK